MAEKIYKGGECPGLPAGLTVKVERGEFSLFLGETRIAWGKMEYDRRGFGGMIWSIHSYDVSDTASVRGIIFRLQNYTNEQKKIRIEEKCRRDLARMMDDKRRVDDAFEGWKRGLA